MVIGNGMIANYVKKIDRNDVVFFASGVSDSNCKNENDYQREVELLERKIKLGGTIVYFSSIPGYIINKRYLEHKKKIEDLIEKSGKKFIILRIPHLIGRGGNRSNFINYLWSSINEDREVNIFTVKRSLLDVDDLIRILDILIDEDFTGFFDINYVELSDINEYIRIIEDISGKKLKICKVIEASQDIKKNENFTDSLIKKVIPDIRHYNSRLILKYLKNNY